GPKAEQMLADGWFPFVELLGRDFRRLSSAYDAGAAKDDLIADVISSFTSERIARISGRWWSKPVFADKRRLLEAGIEAFLRGSDAGYIQCLKTLYPELEGIVRSLYFSET